MRRAATTTGLLILALLPVAAAISPDATAPPQLPVAIAQPIAGVPLPGAGSTPWLPEPGLLVLVGSGLMGLAAIVRKTTRT